MKKLLNYRNIVYSNINIFAASSVDEDDDDLITDDNDYVPEIYVRYNLLRYSEGSYFSFFRREMIDDAANKYYELGLDWKKSDIDLFKPAIAKFIKTMLDLPAYEGIPDNDIYIQSSISLWKNNRVVLDAYISVNDEITYKSYPAEFRASFDSEIAYMEPKAAAQYMLSNVDAWVSEMIKQSPGVSYGLQMKTNGYRLGKLPDSDKLTFTLSKMSDQAFKIFHEVCKKLKIAYRIHGDTIEFNHYKFEYDRVSGSIGELDYNALCEDLFDIYNKSNTARTAQIRMKQYLQDKLELK